MRDGQGETVNKEEKKFKNECLIDGLERSAIEGAAAETVQRFGAAAKQHYVAYAGVDNETGKTLHKGLKSISNSKVNPNSSEQNIKQQAGFSAEVKSAARKNAQNITEPLPAKAGRFGKLLKQPKDTCDTLFLYLATLFLLLCKKIYIFPAKF